MPITQGAASPITKGAALPITKGAAVPISSSTALPITRGAATAGGEGESEGYTGTDGAGTADGSAVAASTSGAPTRTMPLARLRTSAATLSAAWTWRSTVSAAFR